ncbi:type II secretion system F family protein [Candidatus Poriferisodalis sp.]|uniref:type II secretion system F family protein n=1 Tax=Candidatus Poriferisodalis sp. TaxID=3101277 RepID=UPI003B015F2C
MGSLTAIALGALGGLGVLSVIVGLRKAPLRAPQQRLRDFDAENLRARARNSSFDPRLLIGPGLAALLALGVWSATGWPVGALIGAGAGLVAPRMFSAPRQRQAVADEIEAYSQWTEQIRDLVAASGSLFEAVTLSAPSAPPLLRPHVVQMAALARTVGLSLAMDWLAAQLKSPYADRLVLGMNIAWDSGARVTEAFESVARSMRNEVEMRRRNEVANARIWTQVVSIVGITVVSVVLMFTFNRGFFDPFGTLVGQLILLVVGLMIFGNILWVLQLSSSGVPVRLLDQQELEERTAALSAAAEMAGS